MLPIRLATALVAPLLLFGCAQPSSISEMDARIRFATVVPDVMSSAWVHGSSTWLLPKRGRSLSGVSTTAGHQLPINADGAYFRVDTKEPTLVVTVDGNPYAISFSAQPTRKLEAAPEARENSR